MQNTDIVRGDAHSDYDAKHPTLELARALISRPSVTPQDAGCQALMMQRLAALGFSCTELPFGDTSNFWAERGSGGPLLVFAGHTDVVPAGPLEQWHSAPFTPSERDGFLYGRGAADMKGSLAAMVVACEAFVAAHPQHSGRIGFLITSDEEGSATDGTVRVVQWLRARGEQIDWCVVGEPSSSERVGDTIKNGRRGSLGAVLQLNGVQGHIAYPHLADNPIHRALPALSELIAERWDAGNAHFPPTSLQLSNIHAGTGATNVIPGTLDLQFNIRFSTEHSFDSLIARCTQILDAHALDYQLAWTRNGQPFLTAEGPLLEAAVAAVAELAGAAPALSTGGGTSDGRFIAPTGAQVIELGPVNASIHKVNEHVRCSELITLTAMYQRLLERLLAGIATHSAG